MQAIQQGRAEEIRRAAEQHRASGGGTYMLTLTLPHDAGDDLRPMRRHVARAWRYIPTGAPWKRIKERIGYVGSVRALEVTAGPNGWHPHLHVLLFLTSPLSESLRDEFLNFVHRRWSDATARPNLENGQQYRAPSREHGVTLTDSPRDSYLAKMGLADELTKLITKRGRTVARRTPLQILADIQAAGCAKEVDIALWREYAKEMHGARQLTWSKGLRARFAIEQVTDDQLSAEREVREGTTILCAIADGDWDLYIAPNVKAQLDILEAGRRCQSGYEMAEVIGRLIDQARGLAPVPF